MESRNGALNSPANIRPFLRWAGSKRRLIRHLKAFVPPTWNKYYEPFLGGGAMFFYLAPSAAEISDASPYLIETYRAIKKNPEDILRFLRPLKPDRRTFDRIKERRPRNAAEEAAQFIFLNKACWNGLFRVNSQGIFNVPFGRPRTDFIIDEKNFLRCCAQLRRRRISIKYQDFEAVVDRVKKNDFVFLDPPYITSHNMNGFADWNERLFSWKDQVRLATMARKLVKRGANLLITNADHPDVRNLYEGFGRRILHRTSTLAGDKTKRVKTSEAIFFGGPAYSTMKVSLPGRGVNFYDRNC